MKKILQIFIAVVVIFGAVQQTMAQNDNTTETAGPIDDIMSYDYIFAVDKSGSMYRWGYSDVIKEALSRKANISEPVDNVIMNEIVNHAWSMFTLTKNGSIYEWISNFGDPFPEKIDIPEPVEKIYKYNNFNDEWKIPYHAITTSGALYVWGGNENGELGVGNYEKIIETPIKVNIKEPVKDIILVKTIIKHRMGKENHLSTYCITKDGSLYVWGYNGEGQLKLGDEKNRISPVKVDFPEPIKELKYISINESESEIYAITNSGSMYMGWYGNHTPTKVDIKGKIKDIKILNTAVIDTKKSSSNEKKYKMLPFVYVLTDDGSLYTWGVDEQYVDTNKHKPKKINISEPVKEIITASTRLPSIYAITQNGSLYSWGNNYNGRLMTGINDEIIDTPKKVNIDKKIKKLEFLWGNDLTIYILTNDGSLYAWGNNSVGQLGIGNFKDNNRNKLVKVNINEHIKEIIVAEDNYGGCSTYAITKNGALYSWGKNDYGQLGINSYEDTPTPTKVDITEPVKKMIKSNIGGNVYYAVTDNGSLYLWGQYASTLLGVEKTENIIKPTKVVY